MTTLNLQSQAIALIDEINGFFQCKNFTSMCKTIKFFTELLYSNQYLIYSSINDYFDKIGLTAALLDCLLHLPDQSRRDILRLLHLFLKTNTELRNQARLSESFMRFLSNILSKESTWNNTKNFKYHIHIAAHIIIDSVGSDVFNRGAILGLVKQKINENMFSDNKLIYIVFYACAMHLPNLELFTNATQEEKAEMIVSKDIIGTFIEVIRDYLDDFKTFYKSLESESSKYLLYRLKSEFSFDQICRTICYFGFLNEKLRMNIYESGLYELVSNIFIIKYVPDEFLLNTLEVLKLPSLDVQMKQKFISGYQRIFDRLSNLLRANSISNLIKTSIKTLLDSYDIQKNSSDVLITIPTISSSKDSNFCSLDRWGALDVDNWLAENNLEDFRDKFSGLTGRGLKQMKKLTMDRNGKELMIELFTTKLDVNLISIFELIGALESLE